MLRQPMASLDGSGNSRLGDEILTPKSIEKEKSCGDNREKGLRAPPSAFNCQGTAMIG
jgi:hypothetical protein